MMQIKRDGEKKMERKFLFIYRFYFIICSAPKKEVKEKGEFAEIVSKFLLSVPSRKQNKISNTKFEFHLKDKNEVMPQIVIGEMDEEWKNVFLFVCLFVCLFKRFEYYYVFVLYH